jgi:protein SCO1/2
VHEPSLSTTPKLAVIRQAPDFTLPDTAGRAVQLSALRGRVVLISFIYTTCTDACPLLTQRMVLLRERLEGEGLGPNTEFLSVTVDPVRDTVDALAQYAARFGAASDRWRFVRDSPEQLRPVLTAYDEWTQLLPKGDIDHPARLHLIDAEGRVREIYSLEFFDQRQAFLDIQALVRESRMVPPDTAPE